MCRRALYHNVTTIYDSYIKNKMRRQVGNALFLNTAIGIRVILQFRNRRQEVNSAIADKKRQWQIPLPEVDPKPEPEHV